MKIQTLMATFLFSVCGAAGAQYSCQATAESYGENIDINGAYTVSFTVTPTNCSGKCRGWVNFDLVYQGKTGRVHKIGGQRAWKSEDNADVDVTRTGSEPYCTPLSSGPCEVRDVKMYNVTCQVADE